MPALDPRATIGIAPVETDIPPVDRAEANIYGDHNGLTNTQIGAMVGAIIGFIVVVLLLLCCCLRRRARYLHAVHQYEQQRRASKRYTVASDFYAQTTTETYVKVPRAPKKPPPAARSKRGSKVVDVPPTPAGPKERIPGGPKFPTYRAIPIPNPRSHPSVRHKM